MFGKGAIKESSQIPNNIDLVGDINDQLIVINHQSIINYATYILVLNNIITDATRTANTISILVDVIALTSDGTNQ